MHKLLLIVPFLLSGCAAEKILATKLAHLVFEGAEDLSEVENLKIAEENTQVLAELKAEIEAIKTNPNLTSAQRHQTAHVHIHQHVLDRNSLDEPESDAIRQKIADHKRKLEQLKTRK